MNWEVREGDCVEAMRAMPEASVDSIVCDPPYGLEFMGKEWDRLSTPGAVILDPATERGGFQDGNGGNPYSRSRIEYGRGAGGESKAMQEWHEAWAREALRVLKPGGHLLAFGGTRTYHRLACAIEDAGFEIRDCLAWLYGSGFPKSLDVSKAIDGYDAPIAQTASALEFTAWMRSTGVTAKQINEATGTFMGSHYTTASSQPQIPTAEHWAKIRAIVPGEIPAWVDQMIGVRAVSENLQRREVVGEYERSELVYAPGSGASASRRVVEETVAHTSEAQRWQGWGTALKPAHEPVVMARKPLAGTVARNVLQHGTGALNVDGCRIEAGEDYDVPAGGEPVFNNTAYGKGLGVSNGTHAAGRWPANVVLDEQAAAMLDEQTGELHSQDPTTRRSGSTVQGVTEMGTGESVEYADRGGASRFLYVAKASSAERNAGLDGFEEQVAGGMSARADGSLDGHITRSRNVHPTVKPIELMRWLVRLVTPPNGLVLDPFAGSGTTGCAAVLERLNFVGIEREAEYVKIAEARIGWWEQHPEGLEIVKALEADRVRRAVADSGQLGMFG